MSKRDREHTRQRPEPLPAYEGRPLARALAPEVLGKLSAPHLVAIEAAVPILERYSWEPITMALALDGRACRQRLERQAR
jgi:hypothetical protein